MRKPTLLLLLLVTLLIPAAARAEVDFSACIVRSGEDHPQNPEFHEFRTKAQGFNRVEPTQECRDMIQFEGVESAVLNAPLTLGNTLDQDCAVSIQWPELCGDGWGLVVDGGEETVNLDVTAIPDGVCVITVTSDHVQFKNINFIARIEQINAGQVICANAPGVDVSRSTFNGFAPLEPVSSLWAWVQNGETTVYSRSVKVGWNASHPRADFNYDVERAVKNGSGPCQNFTRIGSVNGLNNRFQDNQVASGGTFCYRVRATRGDAFGPYSDVVQVQIPQTTVNPGSIGTFNPGPTSTGTSASQKTFWKNFLEELPR